LLIAISFCRTAAIARPEFLQFVSNRVHRRPLAPSVQTTNVRAFADVDFCAMAYNLAARSISVPIALS
jgi:hypothetical protein